MKDKSYKQTKKKRIVVPESENIGPLKVFHRKGVKLSIWKGSKDQGNTFYLQKPYRDKVTGESKNSCSYYRKHIEALQEILAEALEWEEEYEHELLELEWEEDFEHKLLE